jgi:UDP-N-acetylglucosamine 1-carboxyvinyltransferase
MAEYRIDGGFPISGSVRASGNKNAALPCIAAALLTADAVTLHNVPRIEDVGVMLDIVRSLGGAVEYLDGDGKTDTAGAFGGGHNVRITCDGAIGSTIAADLSAKIRASILFAGPLLARTGAVVLPPPGGDVIGRRRLDTHFLALQDLGARVNVGGAFEFRANKLIGADIFLDEASVTATENAVMAASLAEGTTVLTNAACEPHVQDLCRLLDAMGAAIDGIGSNILTITGVSALHGADFTIGPDYMEIGSYIGLAAATKGTIVIEGVKAAELRPLTAGFAKLGIAWTVDSATKTTATTNADTAAADSTATNTTGDRLVLTTNQLLRVANDFGDAIPKIDDAPWPGFPADLISIMTVVATQVAGTVLIHEKLFESRMFFVDGLSAMGARIVLCDPHRAVVTGAAPLHGSHLVSPDVRAGMALVIAACAAHGQSIIRNIYQVERGYEDLPAKLTALGAHIERVA